MPAFRFAPWFGQHVTSHLGRLAALPAVTVLILAALAATASPASAQQQTWQLTIPQIVVGGNVLFTNVTVPLPVPAGGTFGMPVAVGGNPDCPEGITGTLSGSFTGALFSATFTGPACGDNVTVVMQGTLNAPFPLATATGATTVTVSGPGIDQPVAVTFTATCIAGCGPGGTVAQQVAQTTAAAMQASTMGTAAVLSTNVQTTNIGLRLASLRAGARGLNVAGLSLNVAGQPVPLAALTSVLGGGASADTNTFLKQLGIFAVGQGSFGDQNARASDPAFDFHTAGITIGGDYRFSDQFILGAAFGYLRTKTAIESDSGESAINGYNLSVYANYYLLKDLYIDGIVTFGGNTYDTERSTPVGTASGDTEGTQFAVSVSGGYGFRAGGLTFGPVARVNYVNVFIDGYDEEDAAAFNTRINSQRIESLTTAIGAKAAYAISMSWGVLTPHMSAEWEHEYKGGNRTVRASLLADPTVAAAVLTASPDRDYFNLGVGVSATFRGGVSAFLHFEEVLGRSGFTNHSFTGGVRFEF